MHPEIIIRPKSLFSFGFKELWEYRELLYFFTWKEIKVRYKQAFLGVLWTLLQPVFMMVVFVLFLNKGLGITTGNTPAPLYYLSGLLVWNLFNHAVTNASQSMISNAGIIKKIYFPRLVIPISAVLTATFDYMISCGLFLCLVVYYVVSGQLPANVWTIVPALLFAWLVTVLTAFSVGTFLSSINVKYRDVRYILPFLVQALFFITPVMYDSTVIRHPWVGSVLKFNPLHHAIAAVRSSLGSGIELFDMTSMAYLVLILLISYFLAIFVFRQTEAYFADIV